MDPGDKLVVTAGQEKRLTLYSLATGKPVRSFRPESDAGEPIKVREGMLTSVSQSDARLPFEDYAVLSKWLNYNQADKDSTRPDSLPRH